MARKPVTDMSAWPSLTLEGNLIAPAMVAHISEPKDDAETRESYCIRKGLTIREEIATAFRVGQSHFDAFVKLEDPSVDATRRFVRDFLRETFGFDDLSPADGVLSFLGGGRVPVVVVPPDEEKLDRRSPTLSTERSHSPVYALQDYLNEHEGALWGLVTNGTLLRLMRDNASLTRPAYIEADLVQIFTNEDAASFSVLWLMIHRSRFGSEGASATDCALERWREAGSREGEVARDRLAGQVQVALKVLGSGFLEANPSLAAKLSSGEVNLTDWFNELLRLVYRLIFLMVAEDRNLLHEGKAPASARKLYAEGYSLASLRAQCFRAATWDRHHDRYEGLKIVFRALVKGEPKLGLPALGGLFAHGQLPSLEEASLRNRAFMEAIYRLSWLTDKTGMIPVNWRAMETEELGSVYESLLELQPQLADDGKMLVFASDAAEQKGNQRKTTGSYYTPDSLVQALLDTALDPVLDKTEVEAENPERALLKLSVIDPACGSGHFLLAAARRIATRLARIRTDGTPSLADFRHALRDVARSCLYGVDRNPMAVELTKVALWIETVDPGLPLGFFDAQIRCGDALLGVFDLKVLEDGIPDAAYNSLTGDDKSVAKYYERANNVCKKGQGTLDFTGGRSDLPAAPLSAELSDLRELPENTVQDVEAKATFYASLRQQDTFIKARMGCDIYIAAFLLPKTGEVPVRDTDRTVPTSQDIWLALGQGKVSKPLMENATIAQKSGALHWPLEFPDIMAQGGFDVVLGNPPWERIKLQEKEFFAARDAEIATAQNKAARDRLIKALRDAAVGSPKHMLFEEFEKEKRRSEATSTFVRLKGSVGGRFQYTGTGDVNTYALFAELFANLTGPGGRAGVIVPTGVATDATTAPFFAHLVDGKRLASLYDFENSAPIFTSVHRSFKFCLLTLGGNELEAEFGFFLTEPSQLVEPERTFTLSPEQIATINPNTKTTPVFRSRWDAELIAKMYRNSSVLVNEALGPTGNPWGVNFMTMFHMSNDSSLFSTAAKLEQTGFVRDGADWVAEDESSVPLDLMGKDNENSFLASEPSASHQRQIYVPLFEAKMVSHYDHRAASYSGRGDSRGYRVLPPTTAEKHKDPTYEVEPFYWVSQKAVDSKLADWEKPALLVFNKVTGTGNERTLFPTLIPAVGFGDSLNLLMVKECTEKYAALYANLSSIILDFAVRRKVGGVNINFFHVSQFPVIRPNFYTERRLSFLTPRVLELTYTSHSLAPLACELGYNGPPFVWNENRRAQLRAELDAFYARAYNLTRDELRYILDPADVMGADYPSETFRVLKEKEIRQHGEYRTQRLVLEAWDRMEANGTFDALGLGAEMETPHVEVPALACLLDGAWAWPARVQIQDRLRYAAQYALWISDPAQDAQRTRILVACLAEPALLTPLLSDEDRAHWIRLIGAEALANQGVARLRPQVNAAWRTAFEALVSSGQLEEDGSGNWIRGRHFAPAGLSSDSAHAQCTAFALQMIRQLGQAQLAAAIAQEDNVIWARFGHAS